MPDGGHDARGNCFHFQCDEPFDRKSPEAWRCSLREVSVDADPYWTTCDNCAEETSEPSGPMRAVVGGMGKKGVPIYRRLPYLNGRRPEIVETGGSGSDSSRSSGSGDDISSSRGSGSEVIRIETEEGTLRDFDSTEGYLRFQEKRERQHPPS
ncbi:hypothetical protein [Salinibacter ruber]|uniref:hypothetical protein n=1 Tax=Salinibacter ruber TaxID=146919 RepID=UPI0021680578|nr:hypothetical protein [Salinibacter ruber]MCS3784707.1 hypothetical protein [Salinibacter ruber]